MKNREKTTKKNSKYLLSVCLVFMLSLNLITSSVFANSSDSPVLESDFQWIDNGDGTATLSQYIGSDMNVVIPSELGGLSVTIIGEDAFRKKDLKSVIIPGSVKNIGEKAFYKSSLTSLHLSDGVETIGDKSFYENDLTDVVIPSSVKYVGDSSFARNSLVNVDITNGVEIIERNAFNKNKLTNVVIPSSVKYIGEYAFDGNSLESVYISDGVEDVGVYSFAYNQIKDVVIPSSVKSIGEGSFAYNELTHLDVPYGVETIKLDAFMFNQLTSISIPSSVSNIGEDAFYGNQLTDVVLPESVSHIGVRAFAENPLVSATILNKEFILERDAFMLSEGEPVDLTVYGYDSSITKENVLAAGHTFIPFGDIIVEYKDTDGNELDTVTYEDVAFGSYDYDSKEFEGYSLIGEQTQTVILSKDNLSDKITFLYEKIQEEAPAPTPEPEPIVLGEITIIHKNTKGDILDTEKMTDLVLGDHHVKNKEFDGYKVIGEGSQTVTLTKDNLTQNIEFLYESVKKPKPPKEEIKNPGGEIKCFEYGNGTLENPYLIMTGEHLLKIQSCGLTDKHFMLKNNINLIGLKWIAIKEFSGSIDGNGYTISNLSLTSNNKSIVFIENLLNRGKLKNIIFDSVLTDSSTSHVPFINETFNSTLSNINIKGTYNGYNLRLNQMANVSTTNMELEPIGVSLYKELHIPNTVIPNPHGLPVATLTANKDITVYKKDNNGNFVKMSTAKAGTVYLVNDTEKGFYKISDGYYIEPSQEITVHIGKGEVRKESVDVYDKDGKFMRTIKDGQQYKVYSFDRKRYAIGNGEYINLQDGVTYVFGWITVKEPLILYKKDGTAERTLQAGERYRVYRADKDELHLGGGFKIKRNNSKYEFLKN